MISVIICSVNPILAAQVKRNIEETIGVPWELVLLDNTKFGYGISKIYNMGGEQAKYDILCFVHEDVLFRTKKWGVKLMDYFSSIPELGIVGVAGSKYKSQTFSGWSCGLPDMDCCNILHVNKNNEEERLFSNPDSSINLQNVVSIDGVFMCTRRKIWKSVRFNEDLLKGFHLYDIHFSIHVSRVYLAAVSFEIDLIHLTEGGDFGDAWVNNTMLWHEKYRNILPALTNDISQSLPSGIETVIKKKWFHRLKREKILFRNKIIWIKRSKAYLHPLLYPHVALFLFYRSLKKIF